MTLKPSDGKVPVLKLWGMLSNHSLPLLTYPSWPGVVEPVRIQSIGQTELVSWVWN